MNAVDFLFKQDFKTLVLTDNFQVELEAQFGFGAHLTLVKSCVTKTDFSVRKIMDVLLAI